MNERRQPAPSFPGFAAILVVVACWALARVPFLGAFDLVSHDGTYYINQARAILSGHVGGGGAFPPGYPLLVSAVMTVVTDGVRAAQAVSALASLAATLALYALARTRLPRLPSLLCAIVFTSTPLFVRVSLTTMSESAYVAWVLLAFVAYGYNRRIACGLLLGAAAVTRPEALAIALGMFALDTFRHHRWPFVLSIALPFVAVYYLNVIVPWVGGAEAGLVPKWGQLGWGAVGWRALESGAVGAGGGALALQYIARLPGDLALLFSHTAGLAFLFAVVGIVRRPWYIALALIPLAINPLFTLRPEARFVVPFVPVVVLFAFTGAASLSTRRGRSAAFALLVLAAVISGVVHRAQLLTPESVGFEPARTAGLRLQSEVAPNATISDRKPYVAFYAGAQHVDTPSGTYDETIDSLVARRVDYLSLMRGVADFFRPELAALLYDEAAILGEPRLRQVYADVGGISLFAIEHEVDIPRSRAISSPATAFGSPRWMGEQIVVAEGTSLRFLSSESTADPHPPFDFGSRIFDVSPSRDGSRVAFVSNRAGNPDVFLLDLGSRTVLPLTHSSARDAEPSWDGDTAVVFASDRSGVWKVYSVDADGSAPTVLLTGDGPIRRPSVSPDRSRIAWTSGSAGVFVQDTESGRRWSLPFPQTATSQPSWSSDSRYLAVAARGAESSDVYIADTGSRRWLRLTKHGVGLVTWVDWHPRNNRIVYQHAGRILVVDRLDVFLDRFDDDIQTKVHLRPQPE